MKKQTLILIFFLWTGLCFAQNDNKKVSKSSSEKQIEVESIKKRDIERDTIMVMDPISGNSTMKIVERVSNEKKIAPKKTENTKPIVKDTIMIMDPKTGKTTMKIVDK